MPSKNELTQSRLKEIVSYDPKTGLMVRISSKKKSLIGKAATCKTAYGHLQMAVDGWNYPVHRLAWLYMNGEWPEGVIDHIDGNPANNTFNNLRQASYVENAQNIRGAHKDSKSGFLGVCPSWGGKWKAQIMINGKNKHLGRFATAEEAHSVYMKAKFEHHEFSRLAKEFVK